MGRLVADLLTLARLGEGRHRRREPVDMPAFGRDAVVDASASRPPRPKSVPADGPVVVTGDADALRQVADNVVGNALSHTRTPATVTGARDHCGAELVVPDTGAGMSADGVVQTHETLMSPRERLSTTLSELEKSHFLAEIFPGGT
jgi:two-component system, OmpR family, sensor kinase